MMTGFHHMFKYLFLFLFLYPGFVQALTAQDVLSKQHEVNKGFRDETSIVNLILINQRGNHIKRQVLIKRLEATDQHPSKALIRFIMPAELMGTTLISHQNPGKSDSQWLYLAGSGKLKRIAGSSSQKSFMGTEFSFEDLLPFDAQKYSLNLLKDDLPGFHSINAIPLQNSPYAKLKILIDKETYQTKKILFYNKKETLLKTATFKDHQKVKGLYFRAQEIVMENHQNKRKTKLILQSIKVDTGLKDYEFDPHRLK
jgi:hypothetical protein